MANKDAAFGFMPVGTTDGSDYHGKLERVSMLVGDTAAIFIGDMVTLSAEGSPTSGVGRAVKRAAAGTNNPLLGSLVSVDPDFTDEGSLTTLHRVASTARTGRVVVGSQVLYVAQEDSVGNNIEATEVNNNINIATLVAGSTVTGRSRLELDSSSAATGATLQFRLHGLHEVPGNAIGTNANWLVSINRDADILAGAGI